ncbi:MAG TPA: hypothetical protein VKI61_13780 [Chitinophagaceae bacterium]|jgi:hypothetical protein|nr:hypothetical protein [Chitinophagaceae bacterium]
MKIWISEEQGDEKIIAYIDQTIYSGNPKPANIDACVTDLKTGVIPSVNFIGIPLNYLKEINLQEGKQYIEVLFGGSSSENLRIKDSKKRTEVFDYFKNNIPNAAFSTEKYSRLKAGKKPLIAIAVLLIIFLWTFYYAIGIEQGNDYEAEGGLAALVLVLASLGIKKLFLLFAFLFAITLIALIRKIKNPPITEKLIIKR